MSPTAFGVVLVLLCTVLEGIAQVLLKQSALIVARKHIWITFGFIFFILEAVLYTDALRYLDVSTAFPIGSLSFVVVTVLSQWFLGEKVTASRWIGIVLICAGTALVVARA
jgi:drug/metabolite transporter (DMT)-like permease